MFNFTLYSKNEKKNIELQIHNQYDIRNQMKCPSVNLYVKIFQTSKPVYNLYNVLNKIGHY